MSESEKITINLGVVDLGKIDLLVSEGVYSNRTDFIRTAIRNQIRHHSFELEQSITRRNYGIGIFVYTRSGLEKVVTKGKKLEISVIGMLHLSDDISPDLADHAIERIWVRGVFRASAEVKDRLADRLG